MAIAFYKNVGTRDIAEGISSKASRNLLPMELHPAARRALAAIDSITSLSELMAFPGWKLEKLRGNRTGQHRIRINKQYRVCFRWNGLEAEAVEIVDYH